MFTGTFQQKYVYCSLPLKTVVLFGQCFNLSPCGNDPYISLFISFLCTKNCNLHSIFVTCVFACVCMCARVRCTLNKFIFLTPEINLRFSTVQFQYKIAFSSKPAQTWCNFVALHGRVTKTSLKIKKNSYIKCELFVAPTLFCISCSLVYSSKYIFNEIERNYQHHLQCALIQRLIL